MAADHARPIVPPKQLKTDYPLIDSDPHVRRVFGYARPSDYIMGAGVTVVSPLLFGIMERVQPAASGAINYTRCMRLAGAVGLAAGIITVYQRSSSQLFPIHKSDSAVGFYIDPVTDNNPLVDRFYGLTENSREEEMDMREMVDKIKKGEPLYGTSVLSPYMQGVAARNSRYTSLFIHVIPWFNVVNHNQHGVDTAKYYRQAERELEAEREKMMASQ